MVFKELDVSRLLLLILPRQMNQGTFDGLFDIYWEKFKQIPQTLRAYACPKEDY